MWRGGNKYRAKRTALGFPSKLEEAVYFKLLEREKLGEISEILRQPRVELSRAAIGYKPDFRYTDSKTGEYIWVEAKGVEGPRWLIIKKLWLYYGPGPLEIYKGHFRRPSLSEVITPKRRKA